MPLFFVVFAATTPIAGFVCFGPFGWKVPFGKKILNNCKIYFMENEYITGLGEHLGRKTN